MLFDSLSLDRHLHTPELEAFLESGYDADFAVVAGAFPDLEGKDHIQADLIIDYLAGNRHISSVDLFDDDIDEETPYRQARILRLLYPGITDSIDRLPAAFVERLEELEDDIAMRIEVQRRAHMPKEDSPTEGGVVSNPPNGFMSTWLEYEGSGSVYG